MENATKALLIAGGVLIAILIITVMVNLFNTTGNVSRSYNDRIEAEEITKFNSNFTKYLGQELSVHEAVTIVNFAESNDVDCNKKQEDIDMQDNLNKTYELEIVDYDESGYISKITIN